MLKYKLVPREDKTRRMTPSVYKQEMLQTTKERQANTNQVHLPIILELLEDSKTTNQKFVLMDKDQTLFQPYPSELVFQNYTTAQTYKLQLHLLNNDKVSRYLKLEHQDSPNFQVVSPKDMGSKVASGLFAIFTVCFTPLENKDYCHKLIFATERERFEVPIRAIGPRGILDIYDEFHLPVCPVKASTEKTQFVRNIGNRRAKFSLRTQRPFSVTPSGGDLDVGESMQITVEFNPMSAGDHNQDLILHYDTGEDVNISLSGACEEIKIHLEAKCAQLKTTYITLASVHTVSLTNTSDVPLHYYWTTWPSLQEEVLDSLRETSELQDKEGRERVLLLLKSDPAAINNLPQLSRVLERPRPKSMREDHLSLSGGCIMVEPAEGEVWPMITVDFTIVFKPEEARLYQHTIFCDITGSESRLPLTIKGEGIGPNLQFSYNLMDMKDLFVGDEYIYEVQLSNKGLIDAPFRPSSPDTTFGRCFSFSPEDGVVPPGACRVLEVTFSSHILGMFSEDLLISVTGQREPLTLTFRGSVIGPIFHFSVPELDFGDVGFGFPKTIRFSLFNTSFVPLTFNLRVLDDGAGSPSLAWHEMLSDKMRNNGRVGAAGELHARPVEFTLSPAADCVPVLSDVPIEMTLCANTVRTYRLKLAVDVKGVGEEVTTLTVNARCVVPDIVVETPLLDFKRCFLNHPYEQTVRLINTSSDVPACYNVLNQECEETLSVVCGSSKPRGVIFPQSSEEIPIFLLLKDTGKLHHTLRIAVFGSLQPPLGVVLLCIGQGPIVHVQSPNLEFGRIRVLTDNSQALQLSNQSPIPAQFTARMSSRKSFWRVEPSEGEVPPETQFELRVVAHLMDPLHFEDKLEVSIQHSSTHTVPLSATGTGTSIVSDRPLTPKLDLGTHFSPGSCRYHFKLTNRGQRTHRLYWRNEGVPSSSKTHKGGNISGRNILPPVSAPRKDILDPGPVSCSSREKGVFSLSPSRVELFPGCSVDMVLTGFSDSSKAVRERLTCRAIVDSQSTTELIMSSDVTCRFASTMLSISPEQLSFYFERVPGKTLQTKYEKLMLTNVSTLCLSMELSVPEPFSLWETPGVQTSATTKSVVLGERGQAELWVSFNPTYCQDLVSQVVDELLHLHYQGHQQQEEVRLHAELHVPSLCFSTTAVDFGCVQNYTQTLRQICITNCSPLPVSYQWTLLDHRKHNVSREAEMLEEEEEKIHAENKTDEGTGTSPTASSAVSLPPSPSVQALFDILPNYGQLPSGDSQQVRLFFYGLENVSREVVAQCHVEEGPTYQIQLRGETSVIRYSLDSSHIDFGQQLFDHVGEAEVTLKNTGKVAFEFSIINPHGENEQDEEGQGPRKIQKKGGIPGAQQQVRPGEPLIIPNKGHISSGAEQRLLVLYLPGVPEVYEKHMQVKVAFLPLHDITLTGEGVFPRIRLNLPQNLSGGSYRKMLFQTRTAVEAAGATEELRNGGSPEDAAETLKDEKVLQMENRLVREHALAVTSSLLELSSTQDSVGRWHKLSKFLFPEYVLDFANVTPECDLSHAVCVTNTGSIPVTFQGDLRPLAGTGFSAGFEKVKNLPCGETRRFTVEFDPTKANQKTGEISVVMPIQVSHGPMVQLRLCVVVIVPAISISVDSLQFGQLQVGSSQMRTIQLTNPESVPCNWSIAEKTEYSKKVDKFLPLHQRKKVLQNQTNSLPVVFEIFPNSGLLHPGERVDVGIRFSPTEENTYSRQLVVSVAESTKRVSVTVQGKAEELKLEFCPDVLQLGPCHPGNTDAEAEVTVRNPCSFPIEFFSLEFDTQGLDDLECESSEPSTTPPSELRVLPDKNTPQSHDQLTDCFTFLKLDEDMEDGKESTSPTQPKSSGRPSSNKGSLGADDNDKKVKENKKSKRNIRPKVTTPGSTEAAIVKLKRSQSLTKFRWDVPANGEVFLRIWFYSDVPGTFEQVFNFELVGLQRQHQLLCRGISSYPSICKDPATLFSLSKKVPKMKDGIQKTYVITPGCFEFGPLLCGKTRERYKDSRFPENMEKLVIHNSSAMVAEVQFSFQLDTQGTTYLLDPPSMVLQPDQKEELTVWAYPTKMGQIKDSVICSIRDNPEPVIIHFSCWGVRPELRLESKILNFNRVLLYRQDSRVVMLHNKTALPVCWRVQGLEKLGDEFSVSQEHGVISPNSSFAMSLIFKAKSPRRIKKVLRLEVSDVEKILGIIHTENIQISAEAYDVALDISPDGCLDFGTIKVYEESKQCLAMKNQGKYKIAFKFTLQQTKPNQPNLDSIFAVQPKAGALMANEKATTVQILCRASREVLIREQPVLSCQVIEPDIGNGGETIAILPIKFSLKTVFSRYKITPACVNFGPLAFGGKKNQSFTIENSGVFEYHFTISRMTTDSPPLEKSGGTGKKATPHEGHAEKVPGANSKVRPESTYKEPKATQYHLYMGVFSVSPCAGILQPGSQQVVTVNCVAEQLGDWNLGLSIDISDRDPLDQPEGVPYRLLAEVCKPGIASDMAYVCEEHHQCHNSSQLSSEQFCNAESVYVREENKFVLNKVLVGKTAQARFRLTNNGKVPCVVNLAIKCPGAKKSRKLDVFDLSSTTLSIPSQSQSFAEVNFTPQKVKVYSAVFEATVEIGGRVLRHHKAMEFDLMGEGYLPSVCVLSPALRNRGGDLKLNFRRVLIGHRQTLPLVLLNDGKGPAQVKIDLLDKDGVFGLKAAPGKPRESVDSTELRDSADPETQWVHRDVLMLGVNEQVELEVSFLSVKPLSATAEITLQVDDNQYSNTVIQLSGEAYQEIISFYNLKRSLQEIDQADEGGNYELLDFGDCHVNRLYQESFTMANHSSSQVLRFEWPSPAPHVSFSPQVGHLHAGCHKEVTVTFCSNKPVTLNNQLIRFRFCQVEFPKPIDNVDDWDDRKTVTKTEPSCSVMKGSKMEMRLFIKAVCDYVKFSCKTDTVHFSDTMVYQTRLSQLQISNNGSVKLEFSFEILTGPDNLPNPKDLRGSTVASRSSSSSVGPLTGSCPDGPLTAPPPERLPISVEPSIGLLQPGATQDFTVCFSPLEEGQFQGRLVCRIPNLQNGDQAPCISLFGRSLLPHCHFDLQDSDYRSGRSSLDPKTRVVEFKALGLSSLSTRCFSVLNPTSDPYSFKWKCEDTGSSPFSCLRPHGTVPPGEKAEVSFKYSAVQMDVVESSWSFVIETLSLSVPFLCVGTTREPLVYLNKPFFDFGELPVGCKAKHRVELVNGENKSFHFSVMQESLLSEDQQSKLTLAPMTGTVAPKERLPLSVSFTPCLEGKVSFRLLLRVKRKSELLALTVRAKTFAKS